METVACNKMRRIIHEKHQVSNSQNCTVLRPVFLYNNRQEMPAMIRRKLALYTLLYIAGIAAGFFIFERSRTIEALGFCAAVIAALLFSDLYGNSRAYAAKADRNASRYNAKHMNIKQEVLEKQTAVLLLCFLAGLTLFAFRSLSYSSAMSYVQDKNYVRGRVSSVSVKNDKVRLIIRNTEKGPSKIVVDLNEKTAVYPAPETESNEIYEYLGVTIEARGEYTELSTVENPGCFDYSLYMKSRGVTVRLKAYVLEVSDADISLSAKVRRYLFRTRESFIRIFDGNTQGFIRGVIFGDKSEIDEDILEEFNSNSTGHILAVSGLHIGFLYGLLRFLTSRKRTISASILIIAVILLYGGMTMWSPATVRACIVMTVSLCSSHFRRCSDLLTSISLAAFIILTFQPYQLFNSGFQLSFLALCGIAFLTGPFSRVTGEALAVMLAVQLGTLPVLAYSYCRINPLSILINVPVILLASVLVPLCIMLLMLQAAIGIVPEQGIDLAELISYAVIRANHVLSFGGGFSIKSAGPGAAAVIMIYILVFGLSSEWTRVMLLRKELKTVLKQGVLLVMPLAMLFSCLYDNISDDEIVFAAVGQGDCVHIRAEEHDVLIDGGGQTSYSSKTNIGISDGTDGVAGTNKRSHRLSDSYERDSSDGYNVGKSILMPYLMHAGADAVDIALVTHLHADHYKGITELAEVFPVGAIGIPIDYRDSYAEYRRNPVQPDTKYSDSAAHKDSNSSDSQDSDTDDPPQVKVFYIKPDTKVEITKDVYVETIWPVEISVDPFSADDPNEHNTVYMIHYKDIKTMVTGDLLEEDEHKMVEYYNGTDTLRCDILKVAHHGSKSSSSEEFLDAADPEIAVIQCGRNNFYGHPHKQTLDRLEERGIQVFRTDLSGAVGIDIRGSRLSVDLYKNCGSI